LEDIPKIIINPLNNNNYLQLIGIINYKQLPMTARSIEHSIGHYTAINRWSESWIEYDDLVPTAHKSIKKTNYIHPHVLMYINGNM